MKNTDFIFEAIIEIPKNSRIKYEFDKEKNRITVDRFLFGTNTYPGDYGYLENTLELDGDPIDVIVWISEPTIPNCAMNIKIIGALGMIDNGEVDTKLIAVCVNDPLFSEINHYQGLPKIATKRIVDFFTNYKNLENKKTEILDWHSPETAKNMILEAQKRYQKYFSLIKNKETKKLTEILKKETVNKTN